MGYLVFTVIFFSLMLVGCLVVKLIGVEKFM